MSDLTEIGSSSFKHFLATHSALVAFVIMCGLAFGFLYFF